MRMIVGVAVAFFAFTGMALAADDPMASFYGNTVKVSGAGGERIVHINKDGTYDSVAGATTVKGTWAAAGDQTCFSQTDPAPAAEAKPYCVANANRAVGDSWDLTAPDGSTEKATLVAGQ